MYVDKNEELDGADMLSSVIATLALAVRLAVGAEELTFDLPKYSFKDFESSDAMHKNPSVAIQIANSLTTLGVIQIADIPFYHTARLEALDPLSRCLESDVESKKEKKVVSMKMADGSYRLSVGARSLDNSRIPVSESSECSKSIESLRFIVDRATQQLFSVLDLAATLSAGERGIDDMNKNKESNSKMLMGPNFSSYSDLMSQGDHLEHLHAYYPSTTPSAPGNGQGQDQQEGERDTASNRKEQTIDLHTDAGLLIAMTVGHYTSDKKAATEDTEGHIREEGTRKQDSSSSSFNEVELGGDGGGLYIQLLNGIVTRARAESSSLIIMVGEGGASWLAPLLGAPMRSVPHALQADLGTGTDNSPTYIYLPTYLHISTYLPTYLPTYIYLSIYLPIYLSRP